MVSLIILAPGLKEFGEDKEIDRLIQEIWLQGNSCNSEINR